MRLHRLAAAAFAIAATAVPAFAQDALVWIDGTTAEGGGTLIYGLPDSDHVVLSLHCDPTSFALTIDFTPEQALAPVDAVVTLALTSNGGKVVLPAARVYLEMLDGEMVEATVEQLDAALVAILTTGEELAVNAGGETMLLPIPGEDISTPFLAACAVMG